MSKNNPGHLRVLRELVDDISEHTLKKKHLSAPEREAYNKLNEMEEAAFFAGIIIGRLRGKGLSKEEVLYAVSALLKMEVT